VEETKKSLIISKVYWHLQGQGKRDSGQGQGAHKAEIKAMQMNICPQPEEHWLQTGTQGISPTHESAKGDCMKIYQGRTQVSNNRKLYNCLGRNREILPAVRASLSLSGFQCIKKFSICSILSKRPSLHLWLT